ncbi:pyridoxal phosphate-dependent transferase [Penicillium atrosanguineum]|uniref:pyridoxal phosphate-dependent transferase n=1 Tax=Penicillium atrosanguineum TaxID=1132637 RepID=UPI0023A32C1B|nr:pyridoxal phosphate-dependent transferase [Penicillium atrosanguineum]KAJ5310934.1 pyridoxal phosphate-dependent transferase [Penicillium atrosanguineum]
MSCLNTLRRQSILIALEAGLQKLREYYAKTDQPEAGNIYTHSTILAPKDKLQYFKRKEWSENNTLLSEAYTQGSELDRLLEDEGESNLDRDKLARYLQAGVIRTTPQAFWRDHQFKYPTLARVARDIFSIPATGAGVERLFNSARDICYYRRGRLNSTTIQDLIIFSCLTQFEIEDEQLELARALEVPEEGENEKISPTLEGIDPISDTEEGEDEARLSVRWFTLNEPSTAFWKGKEGAEDT